MARAISRILPNINSMLANEEKIFFKTSDGLRLCGILSKPRNPTNNCIVLCHGITVDKEELGAFTNLAKKLGDAGYNVLRFDFRGHGESFGSSVDMTIKGETEDLEAAVKFLQKKGFREFGIVAASFGGGPVAFYTAKHQNIVKAIVLWNALIDYASGAATTPWSKKYWGKPAFDRVKKYGFTEIGSRKFKIGRNLMFEIGTLKPWKELLKLETPVLFVHGDADTHVSCKDSVKYSKLVKNGTLVIIKGAEHGFHGDPKHAEEADKATIEFFSKNMQYNSV